MPLGPIIKDEEENTEQHNKTRYKRASGKKKKKKKPRETCRTEKEVELERIHKHRTQISTHRMIVQVEAKAVQRKKEKKAKGRHRIVRKKSFFQLIKNPLLLVLSPLQIYSHIFLSNHANRNLRFTLHSIVYLLLCSLFSTATTPLRLCSWLCCCVSVAPIPSHLLPICLTDPTELQPDPALSYRVV